MLPAPLIVSAGPSPRSRPFEYAFVSHATSLLTDFNMDFLSPKDFSISVVGASPCLDLLVKWFRAGGLAAVPCRTRDELQAGPCRVLVVEQNYNYSDGRTPPLGLARQLGASSCISFCASPLVGVQASQGPGRSDLPKGRLVFDSTRFREPEQAEFQVPDQLGRLILHLRGLTGVRLLIAPPLPTLPAPAKFSRKTLP